MVRALLPIALALAVGAGCYGGVDHHTDGFGNSAPTLLYIAPDVQAVADSPYPVFFAGGSYWQFAGSVWYDSPSWNRGWVPAASVPASVRSITRPWAYAHYHRIGWDQPVTAFSQTSTHQPSALSYRAQQWRGRFAVGPRM